MKLETTQKKIDQFLSSAKFGVVGASADREKYGNKVVRVYQQNKLEVYPVNPKTDEIEGLKCISSVAQLPDGTHSISIITPPAVTEQVVEQAIQKGIKNIWMQPGSESPLAIQNCLDHEINLIADGSCILVVLRYHEMP